MQMQVGALAAIPQLESRTDEQLQSESKHRVAAKAILGARAAERYDVDAARKYFNEALAGCHPQERPALRQMMKASMALAERRPDDLKAAMEKLGQEAPSGRQLFMLRMMGLLIPPASAGIVAAHPRHRPADPARDRAAGGRPRPRQADRAAVRRHRHRPARSSSASCSSWSRSACWCCSGEGARRGRARPRRPGGARRARSVERAPTAGAGTRARAGRPAPSSVKIATITRRIASRRSGSRQRVLERARAPRRGRPRPRPRTRRQLLVAGQLRAGGEPVGDEVAGHAVEQLERLVGLPAREQQPGQLAPSRRVVRVDLERAAQRLLVAARRPARRPRRARGASKKRSTTGGRRRAGELVDHLAVAERLDRRKAADRRSGAAVAWLASVSSLASSTLPSCAVDGALEHRAPACGRARTSPPRSPPARAARAERSSTRCSKSASVTSIGAAMHRI